MHSCIVKSATRYISGLLISALNYKVCTHAQACSVLKHVSGGGEVLVRVSEAVLPRSDSCCNFIPCARLQRRLQSPAAAGQGAAQLAEEKVLYL